MGMIAKGSMRFFLKEDKFAVEKQPVEDCVLEGEALKVLELKNCTCRNVTFRNTITEAVVIENCAFINCRFENTVRAEEDGALLLKVKHVSFTECEFGKLTIEAQQEDSIVDEVHFSHCKFEESKVWVKGKAQALRLRKCEAREFSYRGEELENSEFEEIDFRDVELEVKARENRFEKAVFQNTVLTGTSEKNFFKECDMKGYRFQEKN